MAGLMTHNRPPSATNRRYRLISPLLRRILVVNVMPLVLLVAALLYLDQYQNGLLSAEVLTLREQARIFAGALGEVAIDPPGKTPPHLSAGIARPLLRRLTEPTPNARARLYGPDGSLVADSQAMRHDPGEDIGTEPVANPHERSMLTDIVSTFYDWVQTHFPHASRSPIMNTDRDEALETRPRWQSDTGKDQSAAFTSTDSALEMPAYIRRTADSRLLVTVAEPVQHDNHTIGIIQVTREAREVDASLFAIRVSILALFGLALGLTVIMSGYLARTIARPMRSLAVAAGQMREERVRGSYLPPALLRRGDEIGELAAALSDSAVALWARMDAIERFAADVAHEIKNPLSSINSAIETLRRVEDPAQHKRLMSIIAQDVGRLDRLITDISDASRVDAELSRQPTEEVDVAPILSTLADIHEATRDEEDGDPVLTVHISDQPLVVRAVETRLVQVLHNLIGNAVSFSPPNGVIMLSAGRNGPFIQITVEDEGPGIPDSKLEHIFDRFYSERPEREQFGKHSGLGLSISRQIIEALSGEISADNRRDTEGKIIGARFIIKLPGT
ncbi:Sensor protein chvG [Granulibacter bethesdensis]|nr:Sensor protein chvG [Granulibacter bethesdensis]